MESNTSTLSSPETRAGGVPTMSDWVPAGLEGLAATVAELAAGDPDQLGDTLLAAQVVALRRLVDQLEGAWLHRLAAVDGRGAAGAEAGTQAPSTTAWLRATCRMSPGFAGQLVRTARALHRGPLAATAAALATGAVSYPHAATLADATHDLPPTKVAEAEPVLVDAARRLDPGRLRRLAVHLRDVIDPEKAEQRAGRGWTGGACGSPPRLTAWSPSTGCWTPKPARPPRPPWPHSHGRPRRCAHRRAAARRRPRGAGPPGPAGRAAAPGRRAAAPADRHHRAGQPPHRAWRARRDRRDRRSGRLGRDPFGRDRPAAGLRRHHHPRNRPPPPHFGRHRSAPWRGGRRRAGHPAPRHHRAATAAAGRPHPTARPGPRHPRDHPRPAPRPGPARPRLHRARLRPPAALDRRPPPAPLAPRRPDQPRQPGAAVPHPPPGRPRRRLATAPRFH